MRAGRAGASLNLRPPRASWRDPLREADDGLEAWVMSEEQRGDQQEKRGQRYQDLEHCSGNLSERPRVAANNVRAMRPERDTIAAPDLPAGIAWSGEAPQSMPALTASGPVLVHFFDYAQLNSVRTLPYLSEWDRRYRDAGLSTIGVQAPRFPFGADGDEVAAGLQELEVGFPVAIDAKRDLWLAYGCEGWPSLFLWSTGGALGWFHFGEGEYRATEEAIQEELRQLDALRALPEPMQPLRPGDAPGAKVMPPAPELFPGGSWERPWSASEDEAELAVEYAGGSAYATVEGAGSLAVSIDGGDPRAVPIDGPRLYALSEHDRHESHRLTLRPSGELRIWSVSFAAAPP
jgi:hypothetical protein